MPSYDEDYPTEEETILLQHLKQSNERERNDAINQVKNLVIGSKRCKTTFYNAGLLDILLDLLQENSSSSYLGDLLDCLSSFAKSDHQEIIDHLLDHRCLDYLFTHLSTAETSPSLCQSILRCLRSFTDHSRSLNIFFDHLHQFPRLLTLSIPIQVIIGDILCALCIDNDRQDKLFQAEIVHSMKTLFEENLHADDRARESVLKITLKFFCALTYENPTISRQFHSDMSDSISQLLIRCHRPPWISYYASKFFVHLCQTKIIEADHPFVALQSLSTLIHLCNQTSPVTQHCLETLIYLLNGHSSLHHLAVYNEQFLSKLSHYFLSTTYVDAIRASALALLAVLASHHDDIRKRVAEQDNLIPKAIESCRSTDRTLQLAGFRLFHALSRSVPQLRMTFNETICDILLDTLQSSDLSLLQIASCVISNIVLEFSSCRTRLLQNGIVDRLINFLTHDDHEIRINSIWALRNLSYLSSLPIKQDILNGLTIERIYYWLNESEDEQFLLCLLSLLRNLLDEKDTEILLSQFNETTLLKTLEKLLDEKYAEKIRQESTLLVDHLNSTLHPSPSRPSPVDWRCRRPRLSDYACDDMDQLDCS